jgi:RNA polymerase primary sigma factor
MYSQTEQEFLKKYLKKISKIPLLTPEEEKELARRAKQGDKEALKKLVESNLRFVVSVARQYMGYGVPLPELIAAGNLGLIEAAKRFDPDKGVRFISYAVWWIRQAIMQAIAQHTGAVKLPVKHLNLVNRISHIYAELLKELGKEPKPEQVAERLNRELVERDLKKKLGRQPTEEEIKKELERRKKSGEYITPEEIAEVMNLTREALSLDMPIGEEEDTHFIDFISFHGTEDVEKKIIQDSLKKEIQKLLEQLPEKERKVIELRFGLGGEEPKTLKEIGEILGISRERTRQLENRAIRRLRQLAMKRHLKEYLTES